MLQESQTAVRDIASIIAARLRQDAGRLASQFSHRDQIQTRYCYIDALLPEEIAQEISAQFPRPEQMRFMKSFRETKYTTKSLDRFSPILAEVTFAFQDPRVIRCVEEITGMPMQKPDPHLYAGGLSLMTKGHFLQPHIDNSHEGSRTYYRTLNLLYYVSPGWKVENGGNLELWDDDVRQKVTIPSLFNRLVIMETNRHSWHSVSKVQVDQGRACVSNYYFSERSPDGDEYFHITAFSAPPDKPLSRLLSSIDNLARTALRQIIPQGVGRKDIYRSERVER
jgi:Rps23 Pro-64 3,4-dihydroxylase Tpa1-like proline 4-hydroxylase